MVFGRSDVSKFYARDGGDHVLMESQFLFSNFKVRDFSFVYLTDHRGPGDAEIGEERGVDAEPGIWQDGPSMSRMR